MESLLEISSIVKKIDNKKPSYLRGFDEESLTKVMQFTDLIYEEKIISDEEAANFFFKTSPIDPRYRNLKTKAKKQLLDDLLQVTVSHRKFPDYWRNYFSCSKVYASVVLLLGLSGRNAGAETIRQQLSVAIEYKFQDMILLFANYLTTHTSFMGEEIEYNEFKTIADKAQEIFSYEIQATRFYEDLAVKYIRSKSRQDDALITAKENIPVLKKWMTKYDSFKIPLYYYKLAISYYTATGNHKKCISLAEEAESKADKNPLIRSRLNYFSLVKMASFMSLRDFKNGNNTAKKCLNLFRKGSNNWFIFMRYYFLLAMNSGSYAAAGKIINTTTKHSRYKQLSPERKELWKIYDAYLAYFYENHKNETPYSFIARKRKKFNINRFLNNVPIYSKDKRGLNVAILFLHILFLLEKEDLDAVSKRIDSMKVYASRYVTKNDNFRSNCMMKMLEIIDRVDYDYYYTQKLTERYTEMLDDDHSDQHIRIADMEIIPYEELWEMILKKLKVISDKREKQGISAA